MSAIENENDYPELTQAEVMTVFEREVAYRFPYKERPKAIERFQEKLTHARWQKKYPNCEKYS